MPRRVAKPKRVQARRAKNYKAVHRPTRWGNPFSLDDHSREDSMAIEQLVAWVQKRGGQVEFQEPGYHLRSSNKYHMLHFQEWD